MTHELEQRLFKKYPKIFRQKDLSMSQTAMCWGIDCGDGWYWLLDNLCSHIAWDIERNGYPQLEATQVKEKFGTLRFYYSWAETPIEHPQEKYNYIEGMVSLAESMSASICEICGSCDATQNKDGWITTLCKICREEKENG